MYRQGKTSAGTERFCGVFNIVAKNFGATF
jgi:hypothetical protein